VFPVGIGLRDPRSQKRDLGHPSVSPFDIAEGTSFVISLPTRLSESAAPRDEQTKRVVPHLRCSTACLWTQPFRAGLIFGAGPLGLDCKHRFPMFIPPLTCRRASRLLGMTRREGCFHLDSSANPRFPCGKRPHPEEGMRAEVSSSCEIRT
jgi:hypothetical protein